MDKFILTVVTLLFIFGFGFFIIFYGNINFTNSFAANVIILTIISLAFQVLFWVYTSYRNKKRKNRK